MFTGIIEEKGQIIFIEKATGIYKIAVKALLSNIIKESDSIAIDGVCLTVIEKSKESFAVEAIKNTIQRTTLRFRKVGDIVNLETALTANKFIGGHIVLGHIDTIGKLVDIKKDESYTIHRYEVSQEYRKYIVAKGSIAINGISLTISEIRGNVFYVNLIPYTLRSTNLSLIKKGDYVNIEFDIIGKYIYNFVKELDINLENNRIEERIKSFLEGD